MKTVDEGGCVESTALYGTLVALSQLAQSYSCCYYHIAPYHLFRSRSTIAGFNMVSVAVSPTGSHSDQLSKIKMAVIDLLALA